MDYYVKQIDSQCIFYTYIGVYVTLILVAAQLLVSTKILTVHISHKLGQ